MPLIKSFYDWKLIEEMISEGAAKIKDQAGFPDLIVGVKRGGVVPASLLHRHFLNAELTIIEPSCVLRGDRGHLLLVDDIWDTGKTLIGLDERSLYQNQITIFTLLSKPITTDPKHIFSRKLSPKFWAVFPWEVRDTSGDQYTRQEAATL